jgi:hypothetical protein
MNQEHYNLLKEKISEFENNNSTVLDY